MYVVTDEQRLKQVESVCTFFAASKPAGATLARIPREMPALTLLVPEWYDNDSDTCIWKDADPDELDLSLDKAFALPLRGAYDPEGKESISVRWFKRVDARQGYKTGIRGCFKTLFRSFRGFLNLEKGDVWCDVPEYIGRRNGVWTVPEQSSRGWILDGHNARGMSRGMRSGAFPVESFSEGSLEERGSALLNSLYVASSLQVTDRYKWRVSLGYTGCVSLSLDTDPQGACELFRLRDIPEGKARRAALAHWVREHYRMKRDGGLAEVKKHLRGAYEFNWNGLQCKIKPAQADLDELKRAS